jgi:phosphate transport system substrate-binding protein
MRLLNALFISSIILQLHAQPLKVKGSDTMLPMMRLQAEYFTKKTQQEINVSGGGSGVGIAALIEGTYDLAMSSRELKSSEKQAFDDKKVAVIVIQIANDALSVILNPENTVEKMTREQLEDVFTGKITSWKDLGGEDVKIVVITRENSSGTYEFMKEHVLDKKEFTSTALAASATAQIVYSVSMNKYAISYVGLAYVEPIVKAVSVSNDGGKTFIAPTFNNALDKSYPITRPLYLIYPVANQKKVKPFIDFVLSNYGQKLVTHRGYIPLK